MAPCFQKRKKCFVDNEKKHQNHFGLFLKHRYPSLNANHITDGGGMTIDADWMARVKEIVDYCMNAGLYVILNDHWDGGWVQGTFGDISAATIEKNSAKMKRLWYVWDINNPNRYGIGGIMCIIDSSVPSVFDTNGLNGIMAGVEAARWGGPTSGIGNMSMPHKDRPHNLAIHDLSGRAVPSGSKGLLIIDGTKIIFR